MRIEISLLGGKKKKPGRGGFPLPDFSDLATQIKDPLLIGAIGTWVIALAVMGYFFVRIGAQANRLEAQADSTLNDAKQYRDLLTEQRRALNLRDSLLVELSAIRDVDAGRYVWPHVMEEVTKALPEFTWLVGLRVLSGPAGFGSDSGPPPPLKFELDGRTSEIAAYTRFLRQLANSPWVALVEDGPARRVTEDGRNLTSFEITVTFKTADSSFILTVPVTESVR